MDGIVMQFYTVVNTQKPPTVKTVGYLANTIKACLFSRVNSSYFASIF